MTAAPAVHPCGACCTRLDRFGVTLGGHVILKNINLHLHCGELTAVIGANGAGKTTLLRAMLGELPHTGSLVFSPFRAGLRKPRIGYMPQRLDLDRTAPTGVLDLFAAALSRRPLWLGAGRAARIEAEHAFARIGAPPLWDRRVAHLSGGQLQLVLLALALTPLPDILLLDEPMAGVDEGGMGRFYQAISELRRQFDLAILMVSHDLDAAAGVADRMVLMGGGTLLCDGPPADVLGDEAALTTLGYRADAHLLPRSKGAANPHGARPNGGVS